MFAFKCILFLWPALIGTDGAPVREEITQETKNFLKQYGYLNDSRTFTYGSEDYGKSIRSMQKFAGIAVTGKLDEATKKVLKSPRCGFSDNVKSASLFVFGGAKWPKTSLTYYLENFSSKLGATATRRIIRKAYKFWSDVTPLTFREVGSKGDMNIKFQRRQHTGPGDQKCGSAFDGPSKVLAHAYHPQDGRIHFDGDERWTDGTWRGTNLLWVAAHEVGHALGLSHTNVRTALMYPYASGYKPNLRLPQTDRRDIQEVYGRKPVRWSNALKQIWTDDVCPNLGSTGGGRAISLEKCKERCEQKEGCNSVNYNPVHNCIFRGCQAPVPDPKKSYPGFKGYRMLGKDIPTTTPTRNCFDKDKRCRAWAMKGGCITLGKKRMAITCCQSCEGWKTKQKPTKPKPRIRWSRSYGKMWKDNQCPNVGRARKPRILARRCQVLCELHKTCNAINYNGNGWCVFRACAWPVPLPRGVYRGFVGYRMIAGGAGKIKH